MKLEKYVLYNDLGIVVNNKSFKDLTTMKVGGRIKQLYYPNSIESLIEVVNYLIKNNKRYFVIGNGSNIVASDRSFKDLVISGKHLVKDIIYKEEYFIVSGFLDLRKVNTSLIQNKISTFITLSGIPGTIGGALYMNAGAFKGNISDNLIWVEVIKDGEILKIHKDELFFSYRNSTFKGKDYIILNAAFKIIYSDEVILKYDEINKKRREIHPIEFPNSGSIFKNLCDIKAYKIIQNIGLVNYKIGSITFSDKHSNFIINMGNGKGKDVYKLIILAKKRAYVYEKIVLEEEVILLNFLSYSFYKKLFKKLK